MKDAVQQGQAEERQEIKYIMGSRISHKYILISNEIQVLGYRIVKAPQAVPRFELSYNLSHLLIDLESVLHLWRIVIAARIKFQE